MKRDDLRKVHYLKNDKDFHAQSGNFVPQEADMLLGWFHQWFTDEDSDMFALVESENGIIFEVPPRRIKFINV